MPRRLRQYQPGFAYHLTARMTGRSHWLDDTVKDYTCYAMANALDRTDLEIVAFALMSNHIHIVVRQGDRPLSDFMQPLLTRISLRVRRVHGIEGHVFERRFRAHVCGDIDYLRNAIIYTHLNPCRAGLCESPTEYTWSSHGHYLNAPSFHAGHPLCAKIRPALPLFGRGDTDSESDLIACYSEIAAMRLLSASHLGEAPNLVARFEPASCDRYWIEHFGGCSPPPVSRRTMDLRDIAERMAMEKPGVRVESLRGNRISRELSSLRVDIVRAASDAGHRGSAIARFFNISEPAVSGMLPRRAFAHRRNPMSE